MSNYTYNGWTNRETWLVNLWLGDHLQDMAEEGHAWDADGLEDYVHEVIQPPTEGLLADLCGLSMVDWVELALHYVPEEAA